MPLSHQWDEEDIHWLKQLAEQVPLAEGRMEIHTSLLSAGWRLCVCLAVMVAGCAAAVNGIMDGKRDSVAPLLLAAFALFAAPAAWTYGKRTYGSIRRRPEFVLSKLGLAVNERLLSWKEVTTLDYECKNLRGYRSHTCRIVLRAGGALSLDLDTASLPPGRIMLLIDFYATGTKIP